MRILTVCVGNLCRSPLAERLLQQRLDDVRPGFAVVTSAGTRAPEGRAMEETAAANLKRLGGTADGFVARRLTTEILSEVDLVLTATKDLRTEVLRLAPGGMRRTFTMGEFAAVCSSDVARELRTAPEQGPVAFAAVHRSQGSTAPDVDDPIGRGDEVHRRVADQIAALVDLQVAYLARLAPVTDR